VLADFARQFKPLCSAKAGYCVGLTSLLLEGGAALSAAAWDAGMIDRVRLYVAPAPLGSAGVPLLDGRPFSTADLYDRRVEPCGDDVLIEGDVHRID